MISVFLLGISLFGSHLARLFFTQAVYFDFYWPAVAVGYGASAAAAAGLAWIAARSQRPWAWVGGLLVLNLYLLARVRLAGVWPVAQTTAVFAFALAVTVAIAWKTLGWARLRRALPVYGLVFGLSSVGSDLVNVGTYLAGGSVAAARPAAPSAGAPEAPGAPAKDLHVFHILMDAMSGAEMATDPVIQASPFYAEAPSGIYYSNAFSNGHWTRDSLPQILHGVFDSHSRAPSLNESFFANGYEVNLYSAFGPMSCTSPYHGCYDRQWALARDIYAKQPLGQFWHASKRLLHAYLLRVDAPEIDGWLSAWLAQAKSPNKHSLDVGETVNSALFKRFLANLERIRRPSYNFVHLLLPHPPYLVDEECRPGGDASQFEEGAWADWNPGYTAQLRCANKLLKELVAKLREAGFYEKSLIVVQSDHGKGFGETHFRADVLKKMRGKSPEMDPNLAYDTRMRSVLWVKPPGFSGHEVRTHLAMMIDVPATIRRVAGLPKVEQEGLDLLDGANAGLFSSRDVVVVGLEGSPKRFFLRRDPNGRWSRTDPESAAAAARNRFLPLPGEEART